MTFLQGHFFCQNQDLKSYPLNLIHFIFCYIVKKRGAYHAKDLINLPG